VVYALAAGAVLFFAIAVWASLRIYETEEERQRRYDRRIARDLQRGGDENP
jgi:hypothetical protein